MRQNPRTFKEGIKMVELELDASYLGQYTDKAATLHIFSFRKLETLKKMPNNLEVVFFAPIKCTLPLNPSSAIISIKQQINKRKGRKKKEQVKKNYLCIRWYNRDLW